MPAEDVANGFGARERLVDLYRSAARVREQEVHAFALERLDEDVAALPRLGGPARGERGAGGGKGAGGSGERGREHQW